MKKTACVTRRHRALRRTALALCLLLLLWLTPFYHLTPGQVTRRETKDRMLEGSAEILETRYLWIGGKPGALQLSRTGENTLLVFSRWSFLSGWHLESSSLAQPGMALEAGFLQCGHWDSQSSWSILAAFGHLRSSKITALQYSAQSKGVIDGIWTEGEFTALSVDDGSFPTCAGERYFLQILPLEVGSGIHWNVRLDAQDSAGETLATRSSEDYWDDWW